MARPCARIALAAVGHLADAISRRGSSLDIVGSGGILDGHDLRAFLDAGAKAAMVYSALVFRGPLAPALILREAARGGMSGRERTCGRGSRAGARRGAGAHVPAASPR